MPTKPRNNKPQKYKDYTESSLGQSEGVGGGGEGGGGGEEVKREKAKLESEIGEMWRRLDAATLMGSSSLKDSSQRPKTAHASQYRQPREGATFGGAIGGGANPTGDADKAALRTRPTTALASRGGAADGGLTGAAGTADRIRPMTAVAATGNVVARGGAAVATVANEAVRRDATVTSRAASSSRKPTTAEGLARPASAAPNRKPTTAALGHEEAGSMARPASALASETWMRGGGATGGRGGGGWPEGMQVMAAADPLLVTWVRGRAFDSFK